MFVLMTINRNQNYLITLTLLSKALFFNRKASSSKEKTLVFNNLALYA